MDGHIVAHVREINGNKLVGTDTSCHLAYMVLKWQKKAWTALSSNKLSHQAIRHIRHARLERHAIERHQIPDQSLGKGKLRVIEIIRCWQAEEERVQVIHQQVKPVTGRV